MLAPKKMQRLNELAKKKKEGTLTETQMHEQNELRKEYLTAFRAVTRATLENTKIIDPEGNDVTPEKVKAIRAEKVVQ